MDEFPRCTVCGGKGSGLVTNKQKICAHCARVTKMFFNPDSNVWCQQGFIDISPKGDGGVLKKMIRAGEPSTRIEEGCPAFVQYIGRLEEDGSIFDTTRDVVNGTHVGGTDDPFEFRFGHGQVIVGWDIGVGTMYKGELARFIIAPEYAYGQEGFAPKVESGATLDFEIELIDFGSPLPKFPTKAELDASKQWRLEEEKKQFEENPPPTIEERIANATTEKEAGNQFVAEGNWEAAKQKYDSGFVNIFISKEEWEHCLSDAERDQVNSMKLPLYLNRALCKIKLEKYEDALWDCDQAIALNPTAVKAHFRRALVYIAKLKVELEKEKTGDFWVVEKAQKFAKESQDSLARAAELGTTEDRQILRARADLDRQKNLLNQYIKEYKQAERRLYKEKIMDRMEAENRRIQQEEAQREYDSQFSDMPPLE